MSYFACAPSGSIWAGIPSELEDKVRKSFQTPSCVALGVHDAWFVLWPNGDCLWKLNGHYNGLDKVLAEAAPRSVSVSISIELERQQDLFGVSMLPSRHTTNATILWPSGINLSNTTLRELHLSG
jgi:hypothetical protein